MSRQEKVSGFPCFCLGGMQQLRIAERILIVQTIWDSIPNDAEIELSEAQQTELDRRLELLERQLNRGST